MSLDQLEALLGVQEHDTARDRLRRRRAALPERTELAAATTALQSRAAETREVRARRDTVLADERRLDDESRLLGVRADEVNTRLYSGSTNSPKELQAMQADIDMLHRQRSDVEDRELEVIDLREGLDAEVAALEADEARLRAEIARLAGIIAAAEAEIDAELAVEDAAWAALAATVPDALLGDYQHRRAQNKGAGAARLVGSTCTACHLSIPSTEAERIRRAAGTTIAYCDNCSAILVP